MFVAVANLFLSFSAFFFFFFYLFSNLMSFPVTNLLGRLRTFLLVPYLTFSCLISDSGEKLIL